MLGADVVGTEEDGIEMVAARGVGEEANESDEGPIDVADDALT